MQLVIKIPEHYYENNIKKELPICLTEEQVVGILPKNHGRLIDADEFLKENKDYTGWVLCSDAWGGENAYKDTLEDLINEAPTIIETDISGKEIER